MINEEDGYAYRVEKKDEVVSTKQAHLSEHYSIYLSEFLKIKYAIPFAETSQFFSNNIDSLST